MRNEQKDKVSVIIPTYNHAEFLFKAIHSALNQTYQNIEVIVIDNFSVDNTREIIQPLLADSRLHYYPFDNKGIIAAARNYGVLQSTGEYLAFLDADDEWDFDKLRQQLAFFEANIIAVTTQFEPTGEVFYCYNHLDKVLKKADYKDFTYDDIVLKNPIMTSSLLMRKSDFQKAGGFNESVDYRFIEDFELWLRISLGNTVRFINKPLLKYRVVKNKPRNYIQIQLNTLKIIDAQFSKIPQVSRRQLQKAKGNYSVDAGLAYLTVASLASLKYLSYGLFMSSGLRNKLRAMAGLLLLFIPSIKLRNKALFMCYVIRNKW